MENMRRIINIQAGKPVLGEPEHIITITSVSSSNMASLYEHTLTSLNTCLEQL